MSSDECSSYTSSSSTSSNDTTSIYGPARQCDLDQIGNFLLYLYHRSILTPDNDWYIEKTKMREEYIKFINMAEKHKMRVHNNVESLGNATNRCGYLSNPKRGNTFYKIKHKRLLAFRKSQLRKLECFKRIYGTTVNPFSSDFFGLLPSDLIENNTIALKEDNLLEDKEIEPKISLEYQGTIIQQRAEDFLPTNLSCYICQKYFPNMGLLEDHIQVHGYERDLQFVNSMTKEKRPIFTMTYGLCKNSHNFCFELQTDLENVIIERIIIVQSRSFFYVNRERLPYKCAANGRDLFFVDSHLFTRMLKQPIVLVCHLEDNRNTRIAEQHNFMRSEEFPEVNFPINPYRLPNKKIFKTKIQLDDYIPSKAIINALKQNNFCERLMETSDEFRDYLCNGKILHPRIIAGSLKVVLQIEDMENIQHYIGLKRQNITVHSSGDEYYFELTYKQRILMDNILTVYDDIVLTTRTDVFATEEDVMKLMLLNINVLNHKPNIYVGKIQTIHGGRISFLCEKKINMKETYTLICRPNRTNLQYQYRALRLLSKNMHYLKKFLFPENIIPMALSTSSVNLYNNNINPEQLQAVRNIAEGPRNDVTYIIYGPPGTGKTTTLVECILQVLKRPETKVLVTASSNSACDEVALRLYKYLKQLDMKRGLVRIYARTCEIRSETIDDELLDNSNMYNGQFYPDIEILHEYRVVVCTLSVVAKLGTGGFGRNIDGNGLYTHLFIDEVAASTETEALMAITILTEKSCLIISGDNKQLGPVLRSSRAKKMGLDISLMERLLKFDCYHQDDNGDYDRTIQTRLIRNYRSHPAIVKLYSGLYYNHSLKALANLDDVSMWKIWNKSLNKEYPIIFHAIYDPSKNDSQSFSLYNAKEISVVMEYVNDLMFYGINGEPVQESDIGIISPYKTQYKRIQEELNSCRWHDIETGSVETFQGKEKNIIIVSFARSGTSNLGFLEDQKRLNVTLSRPKSFLILIGNPNTLSMNKDFAYIIEECQRNNTFIDQIDFWQQSVNSQQKLYQLNKYMQPNSMENVIELEKQGQQNSKDLSEENTNERKEGDQYLDGIASNVAKKDSNCENILSLDEKKETEVSQENLERSYSSHKDDYYDEYYDDADDEEDSRSSDDAADENQDNKNNILSLSSLDTVNVKKGQHNEGEQRTTTDINKKLDSTKIESETDKLPQFEKPASKPTTTTTYTNLQRSLDNNCMTRQQEFRSGHNTAVINNNNLSTLEISNADVPNKYDGKQSDTVAATIIYSCEKQK